MNLFAMLKLEPEIEPLVPRLEKAIETAQAYMANAEVIGAVHVAQRIMSDPAVKDALAVTRELLAILKRGTS
jgi:hypothetical protein